MKRSYLLLLLLLPSIAFCQQPDLVDLLGGKICNSIKTSRESNDSARLVQSFTEHTIPAFAKYSDAQKDSIIGILYFRMQRTCPLFKEILDRNAPPNPYWKSVTVLPVAKISKEECLAFRKITKFQYREYDGDTTAVEIGNGLWTDHFKNGTYSQLKFSWKADCSFDIQFIQSDNESRSKVSKPGDIYRYRILEKGAGYYAMAVEVPGSGTYSLFKLYFQ